jgi:hypothetical protein
MKRLNWHGNGWRRNLFFSYHNEKLVFLKLFRYHNSRETIKMGNYEKHIRMAREKLKAVKNAFKKGQHTVW